jgi:HAE1 family hydrophobic/amphiphilic exporter-1
MFTVAAVIFGIISYSRLNLNLLPTISYPTLTIKTEYPGTAPSEIENIISKPIEETCGVVDNVIRISSVSRAELSEVTVEFAWHTNMDFATLKLREKLDLLRFPISATKPVILRYDPNQEPIMKLGLTGEGDLGRIRYTAEREVKQALESIEGVAACSISGGLEDEIHIDINEQKLSLLNIPITTVASRLSQENVNLSAGILKQKDSQYLVRTVNQFQDVEEIKGIIIERRGDVQITLGSVAEVYRGYKERKVISRINGRECIEAAIYRAADANTVSVSDAVTERLEHVRNNILAPRGMDYVVITNQSKFIKNTIEQVKQTALLGGILAILVLLYFLKNLRSTLIIGLAIPISVIITFFLMFSADISLNIISMGGLALGIGMLVDNSIVVLESIQRYRENGTDLYNAALKGTTEVAGAVTASTFTTVAVFFPIVFVEGIAGQLFKDMALTVTFSLLASLVVSLTLVPMLSSAMQKENNTKDRFSKVLRFIFKPLDKIYDKFFQSYAKVQKVSFARRKTILASVVLVFLAAIFASRYMGQELIPVISQGEFIINVEFTPGTSLRENASIVSDISEVLKDYDEIDSIYELIGKGSRAGISFQEERENLSEFTLRLQPGILGKKEDRIMDRVRADLERFPTTKIKVYKPRLFSFKAPLEVVVSGNDLDQIKGVSDELLEKLRGVAGIIDLKSSMEEGYPEIQIIFNRAVLASQDMTINSVGSQIRNKIEGEVSTRFIETDREVDIRVRLSEDSRDRVEKVSRIQVRNGLGVMVPLQALATIQIKEGPAEIRRILQQKSAVITGNLSGISLDDATAHIMAAAASLDVPPEVSVNLAGQSMEQDVAFSSMIFAIFLAVFLVYLVMASQFESFVKPFIIMFTIPLGIIGVVIIGLAAGMSINVIVLIGLIILSGIIVNNAIVLVDYIGQLQRQGMKKLEAITTAARVRWRPILMTTITTILGLLPMALDLNEGFEIRIPLALTLIGGLIFGTFLTLIFIPLVYNLVVRESTAEAEQEGKLMGILKSAKASLAMDKAKLRRP